ncbi:hypothetical protein [Blastococcus tunisiensis]|uniref:Uncharacterized protein n=1 Tax=Blastococcus tunisiensis TaxID=1798228 RepID=A0A1I2EIK6_9ACTN|nr:hypothetical protein [Blastococcus sp. DSM 46838]SFE92523.1 hypothetical protein SAMN05216574_10769 [Blastococcus sp. DSM 46838]
MTSGAGLVLALILGALLGAYLGGQAVEACTVGPAGGPPGGCDTDVQLSGTGAIVGAATVALAVACILTGRGR